LGNRPNLNHRRGKTRKKKKRSLGRGKQKANEKRSKSKKKAFGTLREDSKILKKGD